MGFGNQSLNPVMMKKLASIFRSYVKISVMYLYSSIQQYIYVSAALCNDFVGV